PELGVELIDDGPGRPRRRKNADPCGRFVPWEGFGHRRDIWELCHPLEGGYPQRTRAIRLDVLENISDPRAHGRGFARHQTHDSRTAAFEWHLGDLDARRGFQDHRVQVDEAAVAGVAEEDLFRAFFRQGDELLHRPRRQRWVHGEHGHQLRERADPDEITQRV